MCKIVLFAVNIFCIFYTVVSFSLHTPHILFLQDGKTALHEAAGLDHLEVVNALLQAGADMHLEDKVDTSTYSLYCTQRIF